MQNWIQKIKLKIKQHFCRHNATETVEQVSVDKCDCPNCKQWTSIGHCLVTGKEIQKVHIDKEEYERLMRLNENVKRIIAELKYRKLGEVNQLAWEQAIELLESLYDDANIGKNICKYTNILRMSFQLNSGELWVISPEKN
jgi:hypothetical protein